MCISLSPEKTDGESHFLLPSGLLYGSDCSVLLLSRLVTRRRNSKSFQWQNSKFEYGSTVKMEHTCMHHAANTFQLLAMNYINLVGIATDRVRGETHTANTFQLLAVNYVNLVGIIMGSVRCLDPPSTGGNGATTCPIYCPLFLKREMSHFTKIYEEKTMS